MKNLYCTMGHPHKVTGMGCNMWLEFPMKKHTTGNYCVGLSQRKPWNKITLDYWLANFQILQTILVNNGCLLPWHTKGFFSILMHRHEYVHKWLLDVNSILIKESEYWKTTFILDRLKLYTRTNWHSSFFSYHEIFRSTFWNLSISYSVGSLYYYLD